MNREGVVPGLHAVRDALIHQAMKIREVWIKKGKQGGRVEEILQMAKTHSIPIHWKKESALDQFLPDVAHQGVIALSEPFSYISMESLLDRCQQYRHPRLVLAADHMTDEGNLGALMRTAAFFGISGLVLPRDRSAGVTGRIIKRSSGAFLHLPVARVVNLGRALGRFKEEGFWVIGAEERGETSIYTFDWDRDVVLVLGSENKGLSRIVQSECDDTVRIPSLGQVPSLNVAVAGGIILSEIFRQTNANPVSPIDTHTD
jgi:23S rRNA (guanosine2251-2'-O)-methyltransferase